jgi:hypothetical protein
MRLSHLLFLGADGYKATLLLEDACAEDVMLADRLGGAPLNVSQLRRHHGGRPLGWDSAIPVSVVSGTPQVEPFRRGHERYAVRPSMDATTAVVIGVAIGAASAIMNWRVIWRRSPPPTLKGARDTSRSAAAPMTVCL